MRIIISYTNRLKNEAMFVILSAILDTVTAQPSCRTDTNLSWSKYSVVVMLVRLIMMIDYITSSSTSIKILIFQNYC